MVTVLRLVCVIVAAAASVIASPVALSGQDQALVFTGVTVIDATGAEPRPAMTVVVRNGMIDTIGKTGSAAVPRGSQVVRASGKYLIPGLWDMHVHLSDARPSAIPALVARGVTGVRDMGSLLSEVDDLRIRIADGTLVGPRIVRPGPILNGQAFGPTHLAVADAAEARAAVRTLAKVGVDFIKIHTTLNRDQFLAIVAEAKKVGLPVAGHVPGTVDPQEASDVGQASFEHTETLFQGTFDVRMSRERMLEAMTTLFDRLARNGTYYTPCLIMYKASADFRDFVPHEQSRYVARSANDRMIKAAAQYQGKTEIIDGRKRVLQDFLVLVGMMRHRGVKVMTGTDLSDGRIFPGYSVHEELELLVAAGLPPGDALQAATRVPAEFLRLKDAGTIEIGKRADLVLLNADPLQDIRNTTKIESVVLNGQLINRARLNALLADAQRLAARQ
jgi:imidazolonepropionase-like amidohydrolase